MGGIAANPPINWGLSKGQTVPESVELGGLSHGEGIFSEASYFIDLVLFRKVKRKRDNLKPNSPQVRIPVG
jgi:hypothetical protein